jgi:hypothetical protein
LTTTRRALHGVAELVLAGPQYRAHRTIRLRVTPGGFGAIVSGLRVDGVDVVDGDRRQAIGGTARRLGAALGVVAGAPEDLYHDGSGVDLDEPLEVDAGAAAEIASWFATGDAALRAAFDGSEPILWPEHFDVAVAVDGAIYGVSPGDRHYAQPYAYVVPSQPRSGAFWNAAFGAARLAVDVGDADAVVEFFRAGRSAGA